MDLWTVGLGHAGEAARARMEVGPPPLLVGGRADEGGEGTLHPLTLHGPDPDQGVRHRRAAGVEAVRWRGNSGVVDVEALVESAAEGAGVGGGRAHAGATGRRGGRGGSGTAPVDDGEGTAWGSRSIEGEVDGRGSGGRRGSDEVNAGRRGGAVMEEGGRVGGGRGSEGRRGRGAVGGREGGGACNRSGRCGS